jgi:mannose-6-phosphate isomerase-like protein (cupin superfamily)
VQTLGCKSLRQAALRNGEVVAGWRALVAFCGGGLRRPAIPSKSRGLLFHITRSRERAVGDSMDFKPTRRVVIGHDSAGKAVALFDGPITPRQRSPGGNAVANLWVTSEFPVEVSGSADRAQTQVGVPPPVNGTIFRVVDFTPVPVGGLAPHVDHEKVLTAMGIDPATQGYARHANTHRTKSIDYAIVLDGEIDMLMDDSQIHLQAGDVLIQQGTNHAWVNNGNKPCRVAFVLIDAKAPSAWEQRWTA